MATAKTQEKIDLFKLHKDEYTQPKKPVLLTIRPAVYLAIDGSGDPAGEAFQDAIGGLYGMAYTLKFAAKAQGQDFGVCKLEAIWPVDNPKATLAKLPKSKWKWTMLIRVPQFISEDGLATARQSLRAKGKEGNFSSVELRTLDEGLCVQMLHIGPYENEHETMAVMHDFAAQQGQQPAGPHHEVYLSDPRRVPAERLRTILRQPVLPL